MDQVISQPFFTGRNTSNPSASGVEIFRDPANHVDAVSSILAYLGNQTNFHPFSQTPQESARYFLSYVSAVSSFPAFTRKGIPGFLTINTTKPLMDQVVASYTSILPVDGNEVVASMRRMANTLAQSAMDQSTTVFNQMSILRDTGLYVIMYYTTIHVWTTKEGKNDYERHEEQYVTAYAFDVVSSYLINNAGYLNNLINKEPLDEWLKNNSSRVSRSWHGCERF